MFICWQLYFSLKSETWFWIKCYDIRAGLLMFVETLIPFFSVKFCLIHDFPVIIFLQYFDLDHVFPSVQWLEFLWAFKRYNRFVKLIIIALKLCLSYQRFNFLEKLINCKWFSNTVHSNFVHLCFVFVREPKTLYFVIGQWCDLINTVLLDC